LSSSEANLRGIADVQALDVAGNPGIEPIIESSSTHRLTDAPSEIIELEITDSRTDAPSPMDT